MAEENITFPVFKQVTALKGHAFGTCFGGTPDVRVPGIRPTMGVLSALGGRGQGRKWNAPLKRQNLSLFSPQETEFCYVAWSDLALAV